jgi:hypothetical protein
MYPTAALCRSQEALHRGRALEARLENVRAISIVAADAWGKEALFADSREARRQRTLRLREATAQSDIEAVGDAPAESQR